MIILTLSNHAAAPSLNDGGSSGRIDYTELLRGAITAGNNPNGVSNWPGMQTFAVGDRAGVLLDCGAGSLTMYKNGQRLGVAVANGVAGDLHWAASLGGNGTSVRLAALPPPPA